METLASIHTLNFSRFLKHAATVSYAFFFFRISLADIPGKNSLLSSTFKMILTNWFERRLEWSLAKNSLKKQNSVLPFCTVDLALASFSSPVLVVTILTEDGKSFPVFAAHTENLVLYFLVESILPAAKLIYTSSVKLYNLE
jgi:hypothetical protein